MWMGRGLMLQPMRQLLHVFFLLFVVAVVVGFVADEIAVAAEAEDVVVEAAEAVVADFGIAVFDAEAVVEAAAVVVV